MKLNKKLLGISLGLLGLGTLAIPTSMSIVSCSDDKSNNTDSNNGTVDNPENVNPLPAQDTSKITTFQGAMDFLNQYLKQNYTFENFKNDMNNSINEVVNAINNDLKTNSPEMKVKISMNYELINNKVKIICDYIVFKNNNIEQKILSKINNIEIYPYLCWDETNNILIPQLAISFSYLGAINNSNAVNTLNELKQANPNYLNETWVESDIVSLIIGTNEKKYYCIYPKEWIIKNKIFKLGVHGALFPYVGNNGWTILIKGIFDFKNITSEQIQANLYDPNNNLPNPAPSLKFTL